MLQGAAQLCLFSIGHRSGRQQGLEQRTPCYTRTVHTPPFPRALAGTAKEEPHLKPAILLLDTNILLDMPRPEDYRFTGRRITLVVIPEVIRELRGLSASPGRGQAGPAMLAVAALESMANRRGSALGIPVVRSTASFRILAGPAAEGGADPNLVARAKAEQLRAREAMVVIVTRDRGVAERARNERVKSILVRGAANASEIERGIAEHDSMLDIDL